MPDSDLPPGPPSVSLAALATGDERTDERLRARSAARRRMARRVSGIIAVTQAAFALASAGELARAMADGWPHATAGLAYTWLGLSAFEAAVVVIAQYTIRTWTRVAESMEGGYQLERKWRLEEARAADQWRDMYLQARRPAGELPPFAAG
jgi:hypothetical protein